VTKYKVWPIVENPNALFPRVPSKAFPGETTLSCPECGGTNIWMVGPNLLGQGPSYVECRNPDCKFRAFEKGKY
jgi:hypothetical protein